MTTANILGGGAAQSEINENAVSSTAPRYMNLSDLNQLVYLRDVCDPALMAISLISDVRNMLRAALAIPATANFSDEHLRAIVKAALMRIEYDENAVDSEFEHLFTNVAGVMQ